ncbi:hypothetical protein SGCZBJ_03715 [Caulobacter zeae]|uniref:Uncharacterized protein n=1 Tax=Caulobacter zeae TaxID=2055137 RepID=A0A2N5DQ46_9CAUL|nr:hypothetical protein [Caulobacter zeae]PLR28125.1 hypothetical protein SGCZBJ_03715 [Caulobacter zeae]
MPDQASQDRVQDWIARGARPNSRERLEREAEFLLEVQADIRTLPRQRLAELADEQTELAAGYRDSAVACSGGDLLNILQLAGRSAFKARVYAEAARAA